VSSQSGGTHNEAGGEFGGPVVQAGSIGQVSIASSAWGDQLPVPRQLPLAVRDFTGRTEHLAALDAALPSGADDGRGAGAVTISAVDGTAGVGKTALAVHWAHRVQERFPDGTLYVDLHGYGPSDPVTPATVLGGFLGALGISPEWIPSEVDARAVLYRSILAGRRVLILLDNANSAEQVRPLLPGAAGCVVLVTSRGNLTGLVVGEGATRITLDLLAEHEALELVRAILGAPRADAESRAVVELIRACARLPLALRIAAGRAVTHSYLTITELVADLDCERGRWTALGIPADEHNTVRTVFDWSYHRLTDEQARMLRRLGLYPGPEIGVHAAAAVAGLTVAEARRLLEILADAHLIEPIARDRYRFHDLLRAYAADRAERDDTAAERDLARRTLLEWVTHHVRKAYQVIAPEGVDWLAEADVDTQRHPEIAFAGPAEAWEWADLELGNAVHAVRATDRYDLPRLTVLLAGPSVTALSLRGLWDDVFDICHRGLAAAHRLGYRTAECYLLFLLGSGYQGVARWQEAIDNFQAALVSARRLASPELQAMVLGALGATYLEQERYAEAQESLRLTLLLSLGLRNGRLESYSEYGLSAVCRGLGDYEQAIRHAERSLTLIRQTGHRDVEAYSLHVMAQAQQGADAHQEAIALCGQALGAIEWYRDPRHRARVLDTLGTSLCHTGNTEEAIGCWREALSVMDELSDHRAHDLRNRLHGLEGPHA
jgi:tetratricopeptide (TPR) repeat protein